MSLPVKIHPSSVVDGGAVVGEGTSIWHFSHICSGAVIGKSCSFDAALSHRSSANNIFSELVSSCKFISFPIFNS